VAVAPIRVRAEPTVSVYWPDLCLSVSPLSNRTVTPAAGLSKLVATKDLSAALSLFFDYSTCVATSVSLGNFDLAVLIRASLISVVWPV